MKNTLIKVFICVQAAIYLAFTAMDLLNVSGSKTLKFAGMLMCLAFSAYLSASGGEKTVTWAIGFSLLADVLLLLLERYYAVGIGLFCVVQTVYFLRIYRANGHKAAIPARITAFLAAICVIAALKMLQPLNVLAVVYFTFFLCNVVQSYSIKNRLFSIGLCLFICCDVCVGLYSLPLADTVHALVGMGMWTFYLPSQVLITLSGREPDEQAA